MAFRPHRFGRYVIVDPIAVGGMAEIYRARIATSSDVKDGPDRIIIIKKVIANLSQNSEFLEMFEAEIKITVGLTHPNIVQIYDYGRVDNQSFLAMEYVEGKNLRQFVTRLAEMKSMFSIDMSCHIVSQVCHALSYAHAFKDRFTGKFLQIVHRDISPQNVMLSYEGAVKLFDFGIAKAKSAGESTRAGVIKGKPSYLSPEQISGEELDGRSDLFALGIVLWELLTSKRLFVAENDLAILRMIQSTKIEPPSTFNPAIPQALDAIVLKSLARDRSKRYTSAEEFQRDLHRFLYSFNPAFNPSDLSYYAKELFDKEIKEDRERLLKYVAIEPIGEDDLAAEEAEAASSKKKPAARKDSGHKPIEGIVTTEEYNRAAVEEILTASTRINHDKGSIKIDQNSPGDIAPAAPKIGNSTRLEVAPGAWVNRGNLPPPAPGTRKISSEVIPPWSKDQTSGGFSSPTKTTSRRGLRSTHADQAIAELKSGGGAKGISFVAALAALAVLVFVAGQAGYLDSTPLAQYFPKEEDTRLAALQKKTINRNPANEALDPNGHDLAPAERPVEAAPVPPKTAALPSSAAVGSMATVIVKTSNQEMFASLKVSVNGLPVVMTERQFAVPIKTKSLIKFSARNYAAISVEVEIPEVKTVGLNVDLKPLPSGKIYFTTVPEAQVTFYSDFQEPIIATTPLSDFELAEGKYSVVIENDLMGYHAEFPLVMTRDKVMRLPDKALK